MGLDRFSNVGSFEEMAEQNEAAEVKATPAEPTAEVTADAAKAAEPCACDEPCTDPGCTCEETPKAE